MRRLVIPILLTPVFFAGCATRTNKTVVPTGGTLAELRNVRPDLQEMRVDQGLDQAMINYRRFLEETPETELTPEAMRRLADLQIEKQFGIRTGNAKPREMAAPKPGQTLADAPAASISSTGPKESDQEFERRTTAEAAAVEVARTGEDPRRPTGSNRPL
jgi:hypothetical protein